MIKEKYKKQGALLENNDIIYNLRIIKRDETKIHTKNGKKLEPNRYYYICQCVHCGDTMSSSKENILARRSFCKCRLMKRKKERDKNKRKYLEKGDKFEKLSVIGVNKERSDLKNKPPSKWYYDCLCDCGNKFTVMGGRLKHTTSYIIKDCGCSKNWKNSIKYPKYLKKGMKYNKLTVLSIDPTCDIKNTQPTQWKYLCKCTCGNITSVNKNALCSRKIISCGCEKHKYNEYTIIDNIIYVKDRKTNKEFTISLCDKNVLDKACWNIGKNGYVKGFVKSLNKHMSLHRVLMNCYNRHIFIDHIDHNPLNNTRSNIRYSNALHNANNKKIYKNNKTGYAGINYNKQNNKWMARIGYNHQDYFLGYYTDKNDAILIRQEAEMYIKTTSDIYKKLSSICKGIYTGRKCKKECVYKHYRKKFNNIITHETFLEIIISKKKSILIDKEDMFLLDMSYWNINPQGYAYGKYNKKTILMHRHIMNAPYNKIVDHINHNKIDNRKCNLRLVTPKENSKNRTLSPKNKAGYTGVFQFKNKWKARIVSDYKSYWLGTFDNKEDAIKARKEAEQKYHKGI